MALISHLTFPSSLQGFNTPLQTRLQFIISKQLSSSPQIRTAQIYTLLHSNVCETTDLMHLVVKSDKHDEEYVFPSKIPAFWQLVVWSENNTHCRPTSHRRIQPHNCRQKQHSSADSQLVSLSKGTQVNTISIWLLPWWG